MLDNRRRKVYLNEMKRLIMQNMPDAPSVQTSVVKSSLFDDCNQDATSLQIEIDTTVFNLALGALVDEQYVVYFSDQDIRPTRCGLDGYK